MPRPARRAHDSVQSKAKKMRQAQVLCTSYLLHIHSLRCRAAALELKLCWMQVREHLIGMLENTDNKGTASLQAILSGDTLEQDIEGPVLLQRKLKTASRVLRAIHLCETSAVETISLRALQEECEIKSGRSRRAWRGLYFILLFAAYASALIMQRAGPLPPPLPGSTLRDRDRRPPPAQGSAASSLRARSSTTTSRRATTRRPRGRSPCPPNQHFPSSSF
jgi:hypothetical protein